MYIFIAAYEEHWLNFSEIMQFIEILTQYFSKNWIELIGAFTGLICVYLNVKENIWSFPLAIVTCAFYVVFFYKTKFYADMGLNILFIILGFIGWYQWLYGGNNKTELKITHISVSELIWSLCFGLGFTAIAFYYFNNYTDATAPFWDSFNTAFSLVAQYLLNKKRLENWIFWIMVDVIYVPMFLIREKYPTAGLYIIYLILATIGYLSWRKKVVGKNIEEKFQVI